MTAGGCTRSAMSSPGSRRSPSSWVCRSRTRRRATPPAARLALRSRARAGSSERATLHERFGDLHGVERGALADVVAAHEQRESVVGTLVTADPADVGRI